MAVRRRACHALALAIYESSDYWRLPVQECDSLLGAMIALDSRHGGMLRDELVHDTTIVSMVEQHAIGFTHLSFQEYLAAEALENDPSAVIERFAALRLPKIASVQVKRHVSIRGGLRRAGLVGVCSGR
ncbi:hypothetical protein ACBJ59_52075 [Nonomuraea sp. MTCD27]|uniref:hypothetical protein n=1 Tax=Nonomuraea sp. MTCD27 TaxID=1676747 RepID=UPI0035C101CD